MPYAVNGENKIVRRFPNRVGGDLIALAIDPTEALELVTFANRGENAGTVHIDWPPLDAYRAKCRELIGDYVRSPGIDADDDDEGYPLPVEASDSEITIWLSSMIEDLRDRGNELDAICVRQSGELVKLRLDESGRQMAVDSLREQHRHAVTDLATAEARVQLLVSQLTAGGIVRQGTVVHQSGDTAVIQWDLGPITGPDIGQAVAVRSLPKPPDGTRG